MPRDKIIQNSFSTTWRVQQAGLDGFCFTGLPLEGPQDRSASYMSFYLHSPRRWDDLLSEPNVPKLYLNLETAGVLRVLLNGTAIFTQPTVLTKPVKSKIPLPLGKRPNHILIKVVKSNSNNVIKTKLSSSSADFIGQLGSSVTQ